MVVVVNIFPLIGLYSSLIFILCVSTRVYLTCNKYFFNLRASLHLKLSVGLNVKIATPR